MTTLTTTMVLRCSECDSVSYATIHGHHLCRECGEIDTMEESFPLPTDMTHLAHRYAKVCKCGHIAIFDEEFDDDSCDNPELALSCPCCGETMAVYCMDCMKLTTKCACHLSGYVNHDGNAQIYIAPHDATVPMRILRELRIVK